MKKTVLLLLMSLFFLLSACGKKMPKELKVESITENTMYIKADGTSQLAYISDFSEKYYNIEELKSYIFGELKDYNTKNEDAATIADIVERGEKAIAVLHFKESKVFLDFCTKKSSNPVSYPSFSKIKELYGDRDFNSSSDEGIKKGREAVNPDNDNVIVVKGPILLQTEKRIKYYTTGKLLDENHLKLEGEDEAVVVFER